MSRRLLNLEMVESLSLKQAAERSRKEIWSPAWFSCRHPAVICWAAWHCFELSEKAVAFRANYI